MLIKHRVLTKVPGTTTVLLITMAMETKETTPATLSGQHTTASDNEGGTIVTSVVIRMSHMRYMWALHRENLELEVHRRLRCTRWQTYACRKQSRCDHGAGFKKPVARRTATYRSRTVQDTCNDDLEIFVGRMTV